MHNQSCRISMSRLKRTYTLARMPEPWPSLISDQSKLSLKYTKPASKAEPPKIKQQSSKPEQSTLTPQTPKAQPPTPALAANSSDSDQLIEKLLGIVPRSTTTPSAGTKKPASAETHAAPSLPVQTQSTSPAPPRDAVKMQLSTQHHPPLLKPDTQPSQSHQIKPSLTFRNDKTVATVFKPATSTIRALDKPDLVKGNQLPTFLFVSADNMAKVAPIQRGESIKMAPEATRPFSARDKVVPNHCWNPSYYNVISYSFSRSVLSPHQCRYRRN